MIFSQLPCSVQSCFANDTKCFNSIYSFSDTLDLQHDFIALGAWAKKCSLFWMKPCVHASTFLTKLPSCMVLNKPTCAPFSTQPSPQLTITVTWECSYLVTRECSYLVTSHGLIMMLSSLRHINLLKCMIRRRYILPLFLPSNNCISLSLSFGPSYHNAHLAIWRPNAPHQEYH